MSRSRSSFIVVAVILVALLAINLLPSLETPELPEFSVTLTGTPFAIKTALLSERATRLAVSPTSIPLQPSHRTRPGETPVSVATDTLLPFPTATLNQFPTQTLAPAYGSATPVVPIAYSRDGKPVTCLKGPSFDYIPIDVFKVAVIIGQDGTHEWWYLLFDKGQGLIVNCWVLRQQVMSSGNMAGILVAEPELPQITQIKIEMNGRPATNPEQIVACNSGGENLILHFSASISTNGPIKKIGYAWQTNAPGEYKPGQLSVPGWKTPGRINIDISVPSQAASYYLRLRTTFPMEVIGEAQFTLKCQ